MADLTPTAANVRITRDTAVTPVGTGSIAAWSLRHRCRSPMRLSRNTGTLELERRSWQVPASFPYMDEEIVPFMAGEYLNWSMVE